MLVLFSLLFPSVAIVLLFCFLFFVFFSFVFNCLISFWDSFVCLVVLLVFVFFVSISFISALIFMISFLLLTLGFVCSSFSSFFRCKVRLFT